MAVGSTINWSPQVKELNLFSLPFLMPDYKAIDALTRAKSARRSSRSSRTPASCRWPGARTASARSPTRSAPIKHAGRPEGHEVPLSSARRSSTTSFNALGANPTQMSWADAQPALSTGAVDGQENPLTMFTVAKMHTRGPEVRDDMELRGRSADLRRRKESGTLLRGRPADRAGSGAARRASRTSSWRARAWSRRDTDVLEGDRGPRRRRSSALTPAEQDAFAKATRPVYDKWAQQIGADLVKKAEAAIAKR